MSAPLIEGKLKKTLKMLVFDALPYEVGGLIIDEKYVHVLQNRAIPELNRFEFLREDLAEAVRSFGLHTGADITSRAVIWHSHPGGGVGPSRQDMQNKTPLSYHLVVTVVEDDIVVTWY